MFLRTRVRDNLSFSRRALALQRSGSRTLPGVTCLARRDSRTRLRRTRRTSGPGRGDSRRAKKMLSGRKSRAPRASRRRDDDGGGSRGSARAPSLARWRMYGDTRWRNVTSPRARALRHLAAPREPGARCSPAATYTAAATARIARTYVCVRIRGLMRIPRIIPACITRAVSPPLHYRPIAV